MTTVAFINQKGGCGKSSSCFHLAGAFAEMGLRVLLIDADPQGSLSQGFFGPALVESLEPHETLATLFVDSWAFGGWSHLTRAASCEGITVVCANQHLARFNTPEPEATGLAQFVIKEFLEEAATGADIVLIDCPPNLYRASWCSMIAADFIVIPVPPEDFGTQGLRAVHQAVEQARRINPSLRRLGHLVSRSDRRLLIHRRYEQMLREMYPELVLSTVIPEASAFKVALSQRMPVTHCEPASPAAKATMSLANELVQRIAHHRARQRAVG